MKNVLRTSGLMAHRVWNYHRCTASLQSKLSKYEARPYSSSVEVAKPALSTEESVDLLKQPDVFGVTEMVSLRDMFEARVHLGHKHGVCHPYMKPYVFGSRLNMDIIDLEQTLQHLHHALNFIAHIAFHEGIILFISRHLQTIPVVQRTAKECGEYAHCQSWATGTFTNSTKLFGAVTRLPDLLIFLNTHDTVFEQHGAVLEGAKMNIPSVGVVDTGSDPRQITYPIPGNDDSPASVDLYCSLFKQAILKGKEKRVLLEQNNIP